MRKKKTQSRASKNALIVIGVLVFIILIYFLFSTFSVTGNAWRAGNGTNFWIRYACEETDTGAIVKDRAGAEFISKENTCLSYGTEKRLQKYYCRSTQAMMWYSAKKMIGYKTYACESGCENNACVGNETPTGESGSIGTRTQAPMPKPERTAN